MNSVFRANLVRFILLVIVQFLLKEVDYANIDIYIYPVFILLLPQGIVHGLLIVICFFFGLLIDAFYNTMGLYASAAVFVAALRPIILALLEPRGGYENNKALTKYHLGNRWFLQYSAVLLFLHTLWVVTLEELQIFSWMWMLRISIIFMLSMLLSLLYQFIFNPKE